MSRNPTDFKFTEPMQITIGNGVQVKTNDLIKNTDGKAYTEVINSLDTEVEILVPTYNIRPANPKDNENGNVLKNNNDKEINSDCKEKGTQGSISSYPSYLFYKENANKKQGENLKTPIESIKQKLTEKSRNIERSPEFLKEVNKLDHLEQNFTYAIEKITEKENKNRKAICKSSYENNETHQIKRDKENEIRDVKDNINLAERINDAPVVDLQISPNCNNFLQPNSPENIKNTKPNQYVKLHIAPFSDSSFTSFPRQNCDITFDLNRETRLHHPGKTLIIELDKNTKNPALNANVPKINPIDLFNDNRLGELLTLIKLDYLNPEETDNVTILIKNHQDCFQLPGEQLTYTHVLQHQIPTTDDYPINTKQYRFPQIHKVEINKQVQELLNSGIIRHLQSPYNTPIWIVPKKEDSQGNKRWRMVLDFRALNNKTIGDAYPLPNIIDILDQLGGARYFSVFDLASGFHQIKMDPHDRHKTAFTTPFGHYEFNRMPFGLKNAPATFQRLMDIVLSGIQGQEAFVYLDDIVVYASFLEDAVRALSLTRENSKRYANFQHQKRRKTSSNFWD
ncbi:uncharacterized protein LOC116852416 [Odontomachus brunneus]|uniref:uncharacterized protein LOC116852416 n=1 Tax=Odontomachus brunneus TaxID=486640 RepID=UPI0013F265CF|nr:uncharacterized protein LOC116852416 [Odontomachus brunneus]